tara:strand:- start:613 stop:1464 length:852 start_codon:yes stop_codon:yes gene_type:complete
MEEHSDPATEIAKLCRWWASREQANAAGSTYAVLMSELKLEGDAQFFKLIAVTQDRFNEFESLVVNCTDRHFRDELRNRALKGSGNLRGFFSPKSMARNWSQTSQLLRDEVSLTAVEAASIAFSRSHPEVIPTADDLEEIAFFIDKVTEEKIKDLNLPIIFERALRLGLVELEFASRFPDVYGPSRLVDRIFSLYETHESISKNWKPYRSGDVFRNVKSVLAVAFRLVVQSAVLINAIDTHVELFNSISTNLGDVLQITDQSESESSKNEEAGSDDFPPTTSV